MRPQVRLDSRLLGELIAVPLMGHKRQPAQRPRAAPNVVLCRSFRGVLRGRGDATLLQRCLQVVSRRLEPRNQAGSTKPFHQIREMPSIFRPHGREFQSKSTTGLYMPHNRFGPDGSLFDKKMNVGRGSRSPGLPCLDKETFRAEIANSRSIVIVRRTPVDIDVAASIDARAKPSSMGSLLFHERTAAGFSSLVLQPYDGANHMKA
jgi:hypothetical protein